MESTTHLCERTGGFSMTKDVVHSERAPIMEWPFPRRILDWVRSPEWMTMFDDAEAMRV